MNQARKSDYTMQALDCCDRFSTIDNLKKCLSNAVGTQIGGFGFVEPGHGLKGRQHWLLRDKDLNDMYCVYKKRRDITLWCFRPTAGGPEASSSNQKSTSRKRSLSEALEPRPKSQCAQKIKDVEDLIRQLKERHGKVFTTEQLSCWAHMYHMEKHGSLETPPDTPFFTGYLKKTTTSTCTDDDRSVVPCASGISPSKRVNLRTESIKQLVEWHSLLEKGGISKEVYDDMQQAILKDIKENMV